MTQLLEKIDPVIRKVNAELDYSPILAKEIGARTTQNQKYVALVSHANARQSLRQIIEKSSILRNKVKNKEIIVVSAIYDVNSGGAMFDMAAE